MTRLRAFSDRLDRAVVVVCAGVVLAMLGISLLGIFYQFVLGDPLSWTYSLARLLLPWLAMLSLTVAFKRGEHVAMAMLARRMPAPLRGMVGIVNLCVIGLFGLALLWYGAGFFVNSTQLFMVSDFLQVSHRWVVAAVPVAGLVLCIHLLSGTALLAERDGGADS
ncbi:MAG: TRAP transporter small permease [Alphaproteobacteria bacterium]|nr:TRAP transporter small permease [Alphaproteobacteria bacterium]MDP6516588.1 TRAP transporter small permease [Alphaproteobacteria bacterium]